MYQVSSEQHRSIISAILRSPVRPPKSMRGLDWRRFLETYFANVDAKDLADHEPKDLAGAALSHLMFAKQRGRAALVRVFNPTLREDGFVSPHTIIDVVNDDMPFLVDSISLALTERALTLHFLAHPIFEVTRDRAGNLSAQHARRARGVRGLGPHAGRLPKRCDGFGLDGRARRCDRTQRDVRTARVDGKPAFHISRVSRISAERRQGPRAAGGGRVQRARHLAAGPQKTGEHDASVAQRYQETKPLAQFELGYESQFSVNGASGRLSGLCRHQAIRRPGALARRAALSGPLDLGRVQRQSARDSLIAT